MQLPRDGLEFAHIVFQDIPAGVTEVEVSTDRVTWTTAAVTGGETRLLLRGPDNAASSGVPVTDGTQLWVRLSDSPEQLIRPAGHIYLY